VPSILSPPALAALQLRAPPVATGGPSPALRLAALAVALLVHWLVLGVLREPRLQRPVADGRPIEVVLITETRPVLAPPPALELPVRLPAATSGRPSAAPAAPAAPALSDPPAARVPEPRVSAPLFDDDARPRLPEAAPSARGFVSPAQRFGDGRRFGRHRPELPGSDQPIVEIGRLRATPTPEQVALGVAQFLLGRPQPDSCDRIELRLLNETHAVVRAIDLEKLQRLCRGGR
jgi:hypothetical protein